MYLNKKFDIVIFGFGLVSKLFLYSISHLNLKIAVINRKRKHSLPFETKRGIALNYSSCQYLEKIGISELLESNANEIKQIFISEHGGKSKIELHSKHIRKKFLSKVLEESHLEKFFLEKLRYKNIFFFNNHVIRKMKKIKNGWQILLKKKAELSSISITTNLLIGIDGSNSFTSKILKIKKTLHNYESSAFVLNCNVSTRNKNIAYQRIFNNGIIAALPIKENIFKIVVTASNQETSYLNLRCKNQLRIYLQYLIGGSIGEIKKLTKPISYVLLGTRSNEIVKKNFLLLGNAAITLNPISAQGFNLARY